MRKYQQLLLLLISCFSLTVLLMYKNENNRLKYVLKVVNFFGRNDAAVLRGLENGTWSDLVAFSHPLPVWQQITDGFHAYSAFWHRNDLIAGGEAIALVVSKPGATMNFRCNLFYNDSSHSVRGKFRFQRLDDGGQGDADFRSYSFFCHVSRDYGEPDSVAFGDDSTSDGLAQKLHLRYIKPKQADDSAAKPQLATLCLNLANFNASSHFAAKKANMLQFFLHHQILGIEDFIVYNSNELPYQIYIKLIRRNVRLHRLPFNFPFAHTNASASGLRRIIEADCLMRNTHLAKHTFLLELNEFVYHKGKLSDVHSVLQQIHHYAADMTRFEMPTFAVCMDQSYKLLVDNTLYDPEERPPHQLFIYRPHVPISNILTDIGKRSISLPLAMILVHRYSDCLRSHAGKDVLHDWRSSLREDFMKNVQTVRNELSVLVLD